MDITLITAIPPSVALGSGTFVAAVTLERGLIELGHRVHLVQPKRPHGVLGYTLHRFAFNWALGRQPPEPTDVTIGLDMDGFAVAGQWRPFVCYPMGVIADEARFERGAVRQSLALQARAEARSVRRADLVLTTSAYSRTRIAEVYGIPIDRIRVVPPAFDVDRWRRDLADIERRPLGPPSIFCVAHLYPRKNVAALIRAVHMLLTSMPDIELRIGGDGPERKRLERVRSDLRLEQNVHFLGQLSHSDLLQEFASCHVFALPSLQEGFGIAFLEAMASGKPIVACRATSTPELVEDGINGFLAAPHDDADLANQLQRLLRDEDCRTHMARANRQRASAFRLSTTSQRLVDLLSNTLS